MTNIALRVTTLRNVIRHELETIRSEWIWLVILGASLIVLGMIPLCSPVIATVATVTTLGVLNLLGGSAEILGPFWCREWRGFYLALLSGALGVMLGLMLLGDPIQGGITLTILMASFLFVGGIFKAVTAIAHQFDGWGWLLLSGAFDLVLGVMIWRELPMSGLTVIGMLLGISLIFRGISWLMVGLALKRLPSSAA
jgi:uncharacterized membrane protein HdeD (DUF308 family)